MFVCLFVCFFVFLFVFFCFFFDKILSITTSPLLFRKKKCQGKKTTTKFQFVVESSSLPPSSPSIRVNTFAVDCFKQFFFVSLYVLSLFSFLCCCLLFFSPASVAQLDARGDQEVAGSTPAGSATSFCGD